ncbi:hypothetical protein GT045_07985 [Streptomyces sp. SID486]|uniref:hypothetical protein n=1 Tax=Streptomyces sp. SID486 TaxID=2690264 RepID=UPI001369D2A2|nr:hypothetical protein [Streptomyces sp. SID486]MYX94753.1 hypothetical protein [Streptomyces sp. SID486]
MTGRPGPAGHVQGDADAERGEPPEAARGTGGGGGLTDRVFATIADGAQETTRDGQHIHLPAS